MRARPTGRPSLPSSRSTPPPVTTAVRSPCGTATAISATIAAIAWDARDGSAWAGCDGYATAGVMAWSPGPAPADFSVIEIRPVAAFRRRCQPQRVDPDPLKSTCPSRPDPHQSRNVYPVRRRTAGSIYRRPWQTQAATASVIFRHGKGSSPRPPRVWLERPCRSCGDTAATGLPGSSPGISIRAERDVAFSSVRL